MIYLLSLLCCLVFLIQPAAGQRYRVDNGSIAFLSKAAIEDIKSENTKVNSIFIVNSGAIAFSVPIREFQFEKQLMKEHFNDKYMESHKFPSSTFDGKITGYTTGTSAVQTVRAHGKLTIHGVEKEIDVPGTLQVTNGAITIKSVFKIKLSDYDIKIPHLLWQNIGEQIDITINLTYKSN